MKNHVVSISLFALLSTPQLGCQRSTIASVRVDGVDEWTARLKVYVWRDDQLPRDRFITVEEDLRDFTIKIPTTTDVRKIELMALGIDHDAGLRTRGYVRSDLSPDSDAPNMTVQLAQAECVLKGICRNSSEMESARLKVVDENIWWELKTSTLIRVLDEYRWLVPTDAPLPMRDIDGKGAHFVVVSGDGFSFACRGNTCDPLPVRTTKSLRGVSVIDMEEAWLVGESGTVLRCSERQCITKPVITDQLLNDVLTVEAGAMRAVGTNGTFLKCGGASGDSCDLLDAGTRESLNGIWGTGADNLWIAGDHGLILHCDNNTCTNIELGIKSNLNQAWGSDAGDTWIIGDGGVLVHCGQRDCQRVMLETTADLKSIDGSGANNVIVSGTLNTTYRWNGSTWQLIGKPLKPGAWSDEKQSVATTDLYAVWGSGTSDVMAAGLSGKMIRWDGDKWQSITTPGAENLQAGWSDADGKTWAVGAKGTILERAAGQMWTPKLATPTVTDLLNAVWGSSATNVWAVGFNGALVHSNGTSWTPETAVVPDILFGVWGARPDTVWAVGESGTVLAFDGSTWTSNPSGISDSLYAIWGSSATDVWVVGEAGTRLHFDGARWDPESPGDWAPVDLQGIWGSRADDVWAVGDSGTILHWDGRYWWQQPSGTTQKLYAVWGKDTNNVWAVGKAGTVVKWTGPH